jgi:organic radical activating enzyme
MSTEYDRIIGTKAAHTLQIYISLGTTCNFNCTYCPSDVHDGAVPWHDITKLMGVLSEIKQRYAWKAHRVYNLLGGEPTNWSRLSDLCQRIKAMDDSSSIMVATNGSRTPRYWRDISKHLDRAIVSVHVAQIDIAKLNQGFKECILGGMRLATNILMDIDHWDKAVADANWMAKHGWSHYITMKPVETMLGSNQLQPYTKEQLAILGAWGIDKQHSRLSHCLALANPRPLPEVEIYRYADKNLQTSQLNNFQSVSLGLDRMKGWYCWLNADKISVHNDGMVRPGDTCDQWPALGNFFISDPKTWDWAIAAQQCRRDRCVCGGDLDTHKFKELEGAEEYGNIIKNRMVISG